MNTLHRFLFSIIILFLCSSCSLLDARSDLVAFLEGDEYPWDIPDVQNIPDNENEPDGNTTTQNEKNSSVKRLNDVDANEGVDLNQNKFLCSGDVDPKFSYRKRVAVLSMDLQRRLDAVDLPYIESQYPKELMRRFNQDRFIAMDATHYPLLSENSARPGIGQYVSAEKIRSVAASLGVQFIVTGHFWDVSFDKTQSKAINLVSSVTAWKHLGRKAYENSTGSYWRQMNIDINLYDGSTGALIEQKQYKGEANHLVEANSYRFGSNTFWQSDYGSLVSEFLDQQADMIENSLACIPMRAQVIAASDSELEINAGMDAFLMPGDKMQLFHKVKLDSDWQTNNSAEVRLKRVGGVTITRVYPMRAVAKLDKGSTAVVMRPGDIVQAW